MVDDDAVARDLLVEALRKEGYDVEAAADGTDAIARGRERRFDLVLTDFRMGAVDGIAVLREFKQCSPDTSIVLLTAFGSMEGAIEAIRQGAYDYLAKPFKKEEIKLVVRRSLEHSRLVRENARFRGELRERQELAQFVGSSPPMLEVYKLVARVSVGKSTVLLEGESGTGKELVARAIHSNSPRRDRPFMPVHCAALPDTNYSATREGRSPAPLASNTGYSRPPMTAPFFSTRSGTSVQRFRSSSCGSFRNRRSAVSEGRPRSRSMSESSRPRTVTWLSWSKKGDSGKICSIA